MKESSILGREGRRWGMEGREREGNGTNVNTEREREREGNGDNENIKTHIYA